MDKFSSTVINYLGYYVYLYIDPRNGEIFYVGKGQGNRCFSHLYDIQDSQKFERIKNIKDSGEYGGLPKIEILAHKIVSEELALQIEAAVIDAIDIKRLTNSQKGHYSNVYGRKSLENIVAMYDGEAAHVIEPSLFFRINKHFNEALTPSELYDVTRGFWVLNKDRAKKAELAFAVYKGIIQEVYKIVDWYEAGATFSSRHTKKENRLEFVGALANKRIRNKYRFKIVDFTDNSQNPVKYCNID